MEMVIPKKILIFSWAVAILASYYALLFTRMGNYFHGGGPLDHAMLDAIVVIAVFLSLEVFRSQKNVALRVLAALSGIPLMLFVSGALWYAAKYVFSI